MERSLKSRRLNFHELCRISEGDIEFREIFSGICVLGGMEHCAQRASREKWLSAVHVCRCEDSEKEKESPGPPPACRPSAERM